MPIFGDRDQRETYERDTERLRSKQTVPYAVAPNCQLSTPRGLLTEGQECFESDFPATEHNASWELLRAAINSGHVLEAHHVPRVLPDELGRVAPGRALSTRLGILAQGDSVTAEHGIPKEDFDHHVAAGRIVPVNK